MKFVKRISYFFVIPVVFLILGIFLGVWGIHFFYPGQWQDLNENRLALPLTEEETAADTDPYEVAPSVEAAASGETLCADTEYVLEEADIVRGTTVETSGKIFWRPWNSMRPIRHCRRSSGALWGWRYCLFPGKK